jgi:replicative DNA helicase
LGKRILAARSEKVSAIQLRNPETINGDGWRDLSNTIGKVSEWPIWIDDSASLTLAQLIAKATLCVKRDGIRTFIVQLRKASKGYENDLPTTADIKETGDIESHSHVVVLIHLPVLGDQSFDPEGQRIIIGKNRNGYLGAIRVKLDERSLQFVECQDVGRR